MHALLRRLLPYRVLGVVLLVYMLGGALLFGLYRYQLNPDGVAYISVATKYAHGQFADALNGYWGPMLSWLLTPFAFLGLDMQAAAKLIALGAGGLTIGLAWLLLAPDSQNPPKQHLPSRETEPLFAARAVVREGFESQVLARWQVHRFLVWLAMVALVPLCWYWALPSPITPDLLMVPIVLGYVYILSSSWRPVWLVAALGLIGAAGYFVKSYFLPFFVVHVMLWAGLVWYRRKKQGWRAVIPYGLGVALALLLISPWVMLVSLKYQQFTFSTSGAYNFNLIGPGSPGHPVTHAGLLPPPNASAVTAWEDPTYTPIPSWNPWSSRANLAHYAQVVIENLRVIGLIFIGFSVFSLAGK